MEGETLGCTEGCIEGCVVGCTDDWAARRAAHWVSLVAPTSVVLTVWRSAAPMAVDWVAAMADLTADRSVAPKAVLWAE